MIHQLKIQEAFAEAILCGEKTFEVRVNDRGFQKGDHVVFNVIDQAGNSVEHPLIGKEYKNFLCAFRLGHPKRLCCFWNPRVLRLRSVLIDGRSEK